MEFREFPNPEEEDYDINSAHDEEMSQDDYNELMEIQSEFYTLIGGFLEDMSDREMDNYLRKNYGIGVREYCNPTRETIKKVKKFLEIQEHHR
jgi:hypothetical protein